jgi:plasmid maintenance system antidote protein VapI
MISRMGKRNERREKYPTLLAYVNAQPRTVSQNEIARRLGLSQSQLSLYIRGHRSPSKDTALRLSRQFGIALDGLLELQVRAS